MSDRSTIEWTDATWGPIKARRLDTGKTGWHCEKVSDGCKFCYSEVFNGRMLPNGGTGLNYSRQSREKVEIFLDQKTLEQPLRWRKPRKVFVCSMTDLFGEFVTWQQIEDVLTVCELAERHTFQILTKRPWRAAQLPLWTRFSKLPANCWIGTSVEDGRVADRIDGLRLCSASVRFLSVEPLIGPMDRLDLRGIAWCIVGGESGHGARPCYVGWIRSIVEQCKAAGVPVFVKQVGANVIDRNDAGFEAETWTWAEGPDAGKPVEPQAWPTPLDVELLDRYQGAPARVRLRDRKGGDIEEWPEDLRVREFPQREGVARA